MPKMKSHSGMGKRVKVTGKGKLRRQQTHLRHNLEKKPTTRTRRLAGVVEFAKNDVKRVKKMLGL
ncbi:MAG: 50S ribosomal protein L35 [Micromonosporaceae bacterium]